MGEEALLELYLIWFLCSLIISLNLISYIFSYDLWHCGTNGSKFTGNEVRMELYDATTYDMNNGYQDLM